MSAEIELRKRSIPDQVRYWSKRLLDAAELFGPETDRDDQLLVISAGTALKMIADDLDAGEFDPWDVSG